MPKPNRILITAGEPAGIGPELVVQLAQETQEVELTAIADPALLEQYASLLGITLKIRETSKDQAPEPTLDGEIACIPVKLSSPVVPGLLDKNNASYVLETLRLSNALCLEKKAEAIVTGPVQKSVINDAGFPFSGHTEFFAEGSNTEKVVMMLATEQLRVALATTHLPLKDVAQALSKIELEEVIRILYQELTTNFSIAAPRILVCGLNPHAGEGGHLGMEEIEVISPALEKLRLEGMNLIGPLPADTLFTPKYLNEADAVLAMYHDQGLPVLKFQGFGNAVNITLGLPYIRTSVDHGTALDLAGKGIADLGSMRVALQQAITLTSKNSYSKAT